MPVREWIFKTIDRERQDALSRALSISPVTASMLLGRGVGTMAEARRWLTMTSESPHDPMGLPDMAVALERLRTAVDLRGQVVAPLHFNALLQRVRPSGGEALDGVSEEFLRGRSLSRCQ